MLLRDTALVLCGRLLHFIIIPCALSTDPSYHFTTALQRLRALEDDLRSARARSDEKTAEASSVREELVREQGLSAVSQERAAVSERQLSIAQERLGEILALPGIEMWPVLLKRSINFPLPSFPF